MWGKEGHRKRGESNNQQMKIDGEVSILISNVILSMLNTE